jgi:hypothetical protein
MSMIPATWEVEIRRILVTGQPGQKVRSYLKTRSNRGVGVSQAAECLPSMGKVLNSNPSITIKKSAL